MRFRCHRCGQTWPDHPVTRVPCPTCRAAAGTWCRRPSGHRAMELHVDREHSALAMGCLQRCPGPGGDAQLSLDLQPSPRALEMLPSVYPSPGGSTSRAHERWAVAGSLPAQTRPYRPPAFTVIPHRAVDPRIRSMAHPRLRRRIRCRRAVPRRPGAPRSRARRALASEGRARPIARAMLCRPPFVKDDGSCTARRPVMAVFAGRLPMSRVRSAGPPPGFVAVLSRRPGASRPLRAALRPEPPLSQGVPASRARA